MINRAFFFEQCQQTLYTAKMKPSQVAGLTFILDCWEAAHAAKDDRWLAYALGTAHHETGFTMQPIHEFGGNGYYFRMYDPGSPVPKQAALARSMKARPGDGVLFHGRGFVQLTWRVNYEKMGRAFGVDLTSSAAAADRALQPELAAKIMFKGMEEGVFTTKKFADFFNPTTQDWTGARRIINGVNEKDAIAMYAKKFYAAVSHTT